MKNNSQVFYFYALCFIFNLLAGCDYVICHYKDPIIIKIWIFIRENIIDLQLLEDTMNIKNPFMRKGFFGLFIF